MDKVENANACHERFVTGKVENGVYWPITYYISSELIHQLMPDGQKLVKNGVSIGKDAERKDAVNGDDT